MLIRHLPTTEDAQQLFSDPEAEIPLLPIDGPALATMAATINALRAGRNQPLAVLTSHNQRSTATIEALRERVGFNQVMVEKGLRNIAHPEWNGIRQDSVRDTELYKQWHTTPTSVSFPRGDSLGDVARRVDEVLARVPARHDYLIVSHSTPLQVTACRLLNVPLDGIWSFYFEAYAVTGIVGGVLARLNDTSARACNFDALYE